MFPKLHKYKKIHRFPVANWLYLDGSELNYSSTNKHNFEGVHILAPDSLETKAAIQIKADRQQDWQAGDWLPSLHTWTCRPPQLLSKISFMMSAKKPYRQQFQVIKGTTILKLLEFVFAH